MRNAKNSVLIAAIKNSDKKAFEEFFKTYYSVFCTFAERYVDTDNAEEIVQDILLWLWENRNMLHFEGSVTSYLLKSIKNRCITLINHNNMRERYAATKLQEEDLYENIDVYVVTELKDNIDKAIKNLPENYKEAFILNRYSKMSYNEIAKMLNVSPKTIDYRIQQALKLLRIELKDYLNSK